MEPIIWTDDFSVGVEQLDEQHKRLVAMINRLIANPAATTKSETVSELLSDMITYAQEHFGTEEALMRRCKAPNVDEHAAEHLEFWEKSVELCSAAMLGVSVVPEAILQYLRDWLETHIFLSDRAYAPYFRSLAVE